MERDLSIAREIQMGILPSDLTPCTSETGLDIHAVIEPAKHVGGDLFEVLRAGDDHVVVVIGDVMGKGVPASLFMAVTVTLLRTMARQCRQPEEILTRLNAELAAQNPRMMFVTMACLVFDLATGAVTGASAGHNPLLLVPAGAEPRFVFPSSGIVLGLRPGVTYKSETLALGVGDTLVLYTDGVTEAENRDEVQFEGRRMVECFSGGAGKTAKETVSQLLSAVRAFEAGAPQADDITILAVRREGTGR
jgi:sigma-B regulation protein RsbU (phosphoserine phosphatase)